jgi:formylglycine-generating enzyme required for sulfatase activity
MAVPVKRPRPLTVSFLALGALVLGLLLYAVLEMQASGTADPGAATPTPPAWLVADDEGPPLPPALPKLAPPLREAPASVPPVGPPPPEHIVPEEGGTSADAGETDAEFVGTGNETEEERRVIREHRGGAERDWRAGAVGRTEATATREVLVESGAGWIGTPLRWVEGLARQRGAGTYPALLYEAPRHQRRFEDFYIDRFEVSNHDYLEYLQRTAAVTYNTSDYDERSLVEVAQALILDPPRNLDFQDGVAWQLFQANRLALLAAFPGGVVKDKDDVVDDEKTFLRIRDQLLPADLLLSFYDRAPPGRWPGITYGNKRGAYPVRDLSLEEAMDYALWAGRHIPSELEWEYAARGPRGLDYPWGPDARNLKDLARGGQVFERDAFPESVPVSHYPDGISWVGCFNMIGNVSEWTRSFLSPYPEATVGEPPAPTLVIRGGSAADEDPLYLRPAYRGWPKDLAKDDPRESPELPPAPGLRRRWTGFRTARYVPVGFSRTAALHYAAESGARIDPALLDPDVYTAWQGLQEEYVARRFGDISPRPGVKALVAQPLRQVGVRFLGEARHHANESDDLIDLDAVIELSLAQPVLVGMLYTDLPLTSTWHYARRGSDSLVRAVCPAGSWYVGLVQTRLALIRPDFGDVYFVSNRPAPKALFNVRSLRSSPRPGPEVPKVGMRYVPGQADLRIGLESQILKRDDTWWVATVDLRLSVDAREAKLVRNWETGSRSERRD